MRLFAPLAVLLIAASPAPAQSGKVHPLTSVDEVVDAAKKVMKRITDEFARYRNKYDFFQDILGTIFNFNLLLKVHF